MKTTPMLTAVLALIAGAPVLAQSYDVETLAEGLDRPWAMTFLPDSGDILMTGRGGIFLLYDAASGAVSALDGAPDVSTAGQGGLLDVALAPDFTDSNVIYMTWAGTVAGGTTTHLGRGTLDRQAGAVTDIETLFQVSPGIYQRDIAHYLFQIY